MAAFYVVEHLDVIEHITTSIFPHGIYFSFDPLPFQKLEKALGHGVIMAVASATNTGNQILRDSPKAGYLAKPLALLANDEYSDVTVFIRARLVDAGARLYFTLGDKSKHALVIESVPLETEDLMDADM